MKQSREKRVGKVDIVHFADTFTLRKHVTGEWSDFGEERCVYWGDIAEFGMITANTQWIHQDVARCKAESPYGDLIAHGLLILSLIPALLPQESFTVVGHKLLIIRGCDRFRFPSPVRQNEYVHARAKLLNVQAAASDKGTILTRDIEVYVVGKSVPAVTATFLHQYF